jgi:hypothetical protein
MTGGYLGTTVPLARIRNTYIFAPSPYPCVDLMTVANCEDLNTVDPQILAGSTSTHWSDAVFRGIAAFSWWLRIWKNKFLTVDTVSTPAAVRRKTLTTCFNIHQHGSVLHRYQRWLNRGHLIQIYLLIMGSVFRRSNVEWCLRRRRHRISFFTFSFVRVSREIEVWVACMWVPMRSDGSAHFDISFFGCFLLSLRSRTVVHALLFDIAIVSSRPQSTFFAQFHSWAIGEVPNFIIVRIWCSSALCQPGQAIVGGNISGSGNCFRGYFGREDVLVSREIIIQGSRLQFGVLMLRQPYNEV